MIQEISTILGHYAGELIAGAIVAAGAALHRKLTLMRMKKQAPNLYSEFFKK